MIAEVLGISGAILLGCEIAAFISNRRFLKSTPQFVRRMSVAALLRAIGWLLAANSLFLNYPLDPKTRIYGVPFVAAVFQQSGQGIFDFIGPLTGPAILANTVFAFLLPQLGFAMIRWVKPSRQAAVKPQEHCGNGQGEADSV